MRLEAQLCEQNLRFDRKEQLISVPTTGTSQQSFAKRTQAPKKLFNLLCPFLLLKRLMPIKWLALELVWVYRLRP